MVDHQDSLHYAMINKSVREPEYATGPSTSRGRSMRNQLSVPFSNMTISCGICSPPRHTASVATRSIIPPGRINTRRLPPALPSRACRWSFSWVFDVSASNPTAGVSWSDVIDRIHHCLQYYVTYAELDSMPPELKGLVNEAFWYNRSSNPDVPGERLPRAMLRCDWLAFNTMFGGTVRNELAKEQCGPGELTTFELLCFPNTAALEKAARRRYYG